MTRIQPPPVVVCPACGAPVPLTADAMCYRCETILPDDLELTDDEPWHRDD